ncbi:MAG: hypothetical protein NTW87_05990 [Planctomycetota bacterium]|nr:hypothetical protein [Planctomycetota bacterium]
MSEQPKKRRRLPHLRLSPFVAVALLLLGSDEAGAVEWTKAATVRVNVSGEEGRSVAGARISLKPPEGASAPDAKTTDARGDATFELIHPDWDANLDIAWNVGVRVEADGFLPLNADWQLFPGAEKAERLVLESGQTTRFRVRNTQGVPLPGVSLRFHSATKQNLGRMDFGETDGQGVCVFVHPQLSARASVYVGTVEERFSPEATEVTVVVPPDKMPPGYPLRDLTVRVLDPNGRPAAGWFVAGRVARGVSTSSTHSTIQYHCYSAWDVSALGADGVIVARHVGEHLAVISPQGVPFLYPLSPRNWPEGERRVTIRIPPVRRTHSGQLVTGAGAPVAGFPLRVQNVQSGGQHWGVSYYQTTPGASTPGWWGFGSGAPMQVGTWTTDADGRYQIPIYFGMLYSVYGGTRGFYTSDLASETVATLRKSADDKRKYKQVMFRFKDEKGALVSFNSCSYSGYAGQKQLTSSGGGLLSDTRGCHLFVGDKTDRIEFKARSHEWKEFSRTFNLDAAGDQQFEVTLPEDLRLPPLKGRVLDPAGKPVEDVSIGLYRPRERGARKTDREYLGYNATTDAEGRFSFPAAPDECLVNMYRYAPDGNTSSLPGWCEPPAVTPKDRDITVRLQPCGSVRVLLPDTFPRDQRLYVANARDTEAMGYSLVHDAAARAWVAPYVQPGHFTLTSYGSTLDLVATVDMKAGEETVVDLRERKFAAAVEAEAWHELIVTSAGQPASGAIVTLYTMPRGDTAAIRKLIAELGDKDFDTRERAQNQLAEMGATAIMPLRESLAQDNPEVRTRAARILEKIGAYDDGYRRVGADLANDGGHVRFRGVTGVRHVAVARVHGRQVGWRAFTLEEGGKTTIELLPARTLVVQINALNDSQSYDWRQARLSVPGLAVDESTALWRALDLAEEGVYFGSANPQRLLRDGPSTRIAADLPVGRTYSVEILGQGNAVLAKQDVLLQQQDSAVEELRINTATK